MNELEIISRKYETFARKVAGQYATDILHDAYICISKSNPSIDNVDSYFYRTIQNCFINHCRVEVRQNDITFDQDERPTESINRLYAILEQLESEGKRKEVEVYKEATFATNQSKTAIRRGIARGTVRRYCKIIEDEIIKRHDTN